MAFGVWSVYNAPTYQAPTEPDVAGLGKLTEDIDAIQREAQRKALAARIPGQAGLEELSSRNIAAQLRGEVPGEELYTIGQRAAEGAVGTGAASQAAYLRALGLRSYDIEREGQRQLTEALGRNPAAPLFDVATQMLTPYQQAQLDLESARQLSQYELGIAGLQTRLAEAEMRQPTYVRAAAPATAAAPVPSTPDYYDGGTTAGFPFWPYSPPAPTYAEPAPVWSTGTFEMSDIDIPYYGEG